MQPEPEPEVPKLTPEEKAAAYKQHKEEVEERWNTKKQERDRLKAKREARKQRKLQREAEEDRKRVPEPAERDFPRADL